MICSWFLPQFLFWTVQTVFVGDDGTLFSVHLEHNGFFCGLGENLRYVSGSIANYDFCSVQTWSLQCLEDMLRHLGYECTGANLGMQYLMDLCALRVRQTYRLCALL